MDEHQEPAENVGAVEDNSQAASPADEPKTSDEPATEGEAEQAQINEPATEETSETERKPRPAERRIRELSEEVKRLREQPSQPFAGFQQPPQPMFEPGQEYSAEELNQRVVQTADSIAQLRTQQALQQFEAKSNLDRDVEVLPKEFPELDETSPNFNPVLVEKVEKEYKNRAFRNGLLDPSVRLADIAKDYVDVARAAADKSSAEVKNSVARTVDESAIRPTNATKAETPFSEKSIEEMEAELGFAKR